RRDGMALRADAAEVHLEVRGKSAERLAGPRPRHRGAAGEGDDAVVVADEGPDPAGAAGAGDAERRWIPARLRDARRRPRPAAVCTRDVGDIEQRVAAVTAIVGHQIETAAAGLHAQLDVNAIAG